VLRALTLYGFFPILLARSLQREWRWLPYSLASLLVGGVALSRLYLGVHWLTDVLGSLMLGTAWIAFLGIAYHRHVEQASQKRLMISAALALSLLASMLALTRHETHYLDYRPPAILVSYPLENWQTEISAALPQARDDLQRERNHPLNLVLAGDPNCLLRQLSSRGWRPAQMLGWHNALSLLSPRSEIARLPVLPQVHGDVHEEAVFNQDRDDGRRHLLRFWPTGLRLEPGQIPVYVGNISAQHAEPLLHLSMIPRTERDFDQPFSQLLQEMDALGPQMSLPEPGRLFIDLTQQGECPTGTHPNTDFRK
jgi:undecaprenyl-diphosphatase